MRRVIDWVHGTPSRLRTTRVSSAVVLSAGVLFVFMASSGLFDGPSGPVRARDSAEIVVQAEVESWEFVFSTKQKPDDEINVVPDAIAVGIDNWIIRFKVLRVVRVFLTRVNSASYLLAAQRCSAEGADNGSCCES